MLLKRQFPLCELALILGKGVRGMPHNCYLVYIKSAILVATKEST